ncbi:MAG: CarD family transcriptional regulator [Acidobacteriota bacterium]
MALQFKKGDKVIYPNHGIGVIEQIADREIGETKQSFYSLRILANDSTVMVPVGNIEEVGLRRIASKREVDRLFRVLKDGSIDTYGDWKGRYQENSDKMRTGSIVEVASVYKNLMLLSQTKPLSYRERKMLDRARYLIVSEVAMVSSRKEDDIEKKLDKAVNVSIKSALSH